MQRSSEQQLRADLVEYGKKLLSLGLVQGTWGNLSVRLDGRRMLVTPSGLDYMVLGPADMVEVDIKTLAWEGSKNRPTSEKRIHAGIYEARPDVGAVIHTHSEFCSVFAAAHMPLQITDPLLIAQAGEFIKCAGYGISGSKKLAARVIEALGDRSGCLMANHGMVAVGRDLAGALSACEAMEKAALQYLTVRYAGAARD